MKKEAIDFEGKDIPAEYFERFAKAFFPNDGPDGKAKPAIIWVPLLSGLYTRSSDPDVEFRQAVVKESSRPRRRSQVATLVTSYVKCKRIERHEDCNDEDWDMVKAWASCAEAEYRIKLENKGNR